MEEKKNGYDSIETLSCKYVSPVRVKHKTRTHITIEWPIVDFVFFLVFYLKSCLISKC